MSETSSEPRVYAGLRTLLHAIPRGLPMPVLRGPLKGVWWGANILSNGCWLGTYERGTQQRLQRLIRPGDVVYDIGANAGYFTLLAARLVGTDGAVVAFEPSRVNIALLQRHLRLNGVGNVTVIDAAAADADGTIEFVATDGLATGHLTGAYVGSAPVADGIASAVTLVQAVKVDSLVAAGRMRPPNVMKIDVEGAELSVLEGARQTLLSYRPRLIVELHNPDMDVQCPAFLTALGYDVRPYEFRPGTNIAQAGFSASFPEDGDR